VIRDVYQIFIHGNSTIRRKCSFLTRLSCGIVDDRMFPSGGVSLVERGLCSIKLDIDAAIAHLSLDTSVSLISRSRECAPWTDTVAGAPIPGLT
jgi:hypothetical protein